MSGPVVFINIGWMKKYAGPSPDDPLLADNFGYFKQDKTKNAVGHEQWNFLGTDGHVYGYVPRSSGINITRLGAARGQDAIDDVLVVFIARDPAAKQLKVVGWYKNATVARAAIFQRAFGRTKIEAPISARESEAYVLPVAKRDFTVPTAQRELGGIGQSPVWYAEQHSDLVRRMWALVEGRSPHRRAQPKTGRPPRNNDPAARLAVEKVAMDWALRYFDDAADVSRQCKGWDVEAVADSEQIYIEVKGISGASVSFELTPNEYEKMLQHKERYLLFVVTDALTKRARARTFRHVATIEGDAWVSEDGETLAVQERIGAWARCQ
ncbi:DUF3883 domain-containing protein [Halomonas sp. MC140]|nr:DUF3883 domain-containing protein [Halomonas sp. MC140]MDN7131329.1 DUF3883 domain-containing protein [Halomonas sp. MC140]